MSLARVWHGEVEGRQWIVEEPKFQRSSKFQRWDGCGTVWDGFGTGAMVRIINVYGVWDDGTARHRGKWVVAKFQVQSAVAKAMAPRALKVQNEVSDGSLTAPDG